MKIYGTTTSPFTRRVRVVATELKEPIELVSTATDAGMKELHSVSPIHKVPVAVVDGEAIYDSRAIHAWLLANRGTWGTWDPRESNLVNAIDAASYAIVDLFYLRRDGVAIEGTPYEKRQMDRADAVFQWLAPQVTKGSFTGGFGLPELSLICCLDWMEFRKAYPMERTAGVEAVRTRWRDRPSLVSTLPHT